MEELKTEATFHLIEGRLAKILFLDDRSKRIHSALSIFRDCDLRIVTNVTECLYYLAREDWDIVYLDHDLGGKEFCALGDPTCGMAVVSYLKWNKWPPEKKKPEIVIHSSNVFAATCMEQDLREMFFSVSRKPWEYA